MARNWYILHVFAGHEAKIERVIRAMLENGDLSSDYILDVKVPTEDVKEVRNGKERTTSKIILPGYVMVEMDLPDLGWKDVCSSLRRIQGITGFVGTNPNVRPRPITNEEAKRLLMSATELRGEMNARIRQMYEVGEKVRIIDGPCASFTGEIAEVNAEKNKLRVMVEVFNRETSVEVDVKQVEKI